MIDSTGALRFMRSHHSFIIVGHKEPDGDCIASQLAAASLLRLLGAEATLHSAGPFDRPEISAFAGSFASTIPEERRQGSAAVIVDCSTPDRTGPLGSRVAGLPCLVIDHHSAGEQFGDARFVDPSAPSTSVLIQQLFDDAGVPYDADTARLMLFGLCTDTGFFRHLGPNSSRTFHAIARLVEHGTSTADIYMMVYGMRELSARRLLAEMLSRTESHRGDRLLITWQTRADRERLSAYQRGEDDLYRLLQTIKDNVVVALIKEEGELMFSVGLRSTTAVDVGTIAASFGGGGHKQAAGFDIPGTLSHVKTTLLDTLLPLVDKL
jgi:phosphoesterase RecJ-like protein